MLCVVHVFHFKPSYPHAPCFSCPLCPTLFQIRTKFYFFVMYYGNHTRIVLRWFKNRLFVLLQWFDARTIFSRVQTAKNKTEPTASQGVTREIV